MAQLIDKSALVAEIKRYKHKADERLKIKGRTLAEDCKDSALQNLCGNLLHFLDTLEVKEVDLNKEFDLYSKDILACDVQFEPFTHLFKCARHFFELGMRVSNPVTAADRGMVEEIIINLKRVEQDYHIDLTKEMEWLRNLMKKGK